jgi:AcrR family transcriptional regulator
MIRMATRSPSTGVVDAGSPAGGPTDSAEVEGVVARPMRADALRNRARILDAAEEIFAVEGVNVPIDAVAERAGVGVGTLYRHFPTKEALFEAIVMTRLEELLAATRERAAAEQPGDALFSFLRDFAQQANAKQDLFEALSSAGIDIKSQCAGMVDDLMAGVDQLVQRAASVGAIRADVPTDELLSLIIGACHAGGHSGISNDGVQRMVGVVIDGLQPLPTQ